MQGISPEKQRLAQPERRLDGHTCPLVVVVRALQLPFGFTLCTCHAPVSPRSPSRTKANGTKVKSRDCCWSLRGRSCSEVWSGEKLSVLCTSSRPN